MGAPYSHPPEDGDDGVLLKDHLEDVADRVAYVVPADAKTPSEESLREIVETLAWIHDFGKATTYFQQYLGVASGSPRKDLFRHHSPISAFAAYYSLDAQGFDDETCLAGFVAVAKHHGRLPNVARYVYDRSHRRDNPPAGAETTNEKRQTAIVKQIVDIDDNEPELAELIFEKAAKGDGDWTDFRSGFLNLLSEIESLVASSGDVPGVRESALSDRCYGLVLQSWGALVLADKTSAARAPPDASTYSAEPPSVGRLDEYVERLETEADADPDGTRSQRLNHFRSSARESVLEETATFADDGGGVATLTLPTGMGKTLSGLSAAFELRNRLGGERVIYALPFTSVIDQVVSEVETIYDTDTTGRLLTAHHHLSEATIRAGDTENDADEADLDDDGVAAMLGEGWRAGLTVSTFVQLFESLAGPANRQSLKLPALQNSVIVLDEPQSLPLDWWKLVPRLGAMLTEQFDASVIAMTATQPRLFDGATELVDDPAKYFEATERVRYELDSSTERYIAHQEGPKSYDDAAALISEAISAGESTLAICNTIDSANELRERVDRVEPSSVDVAAEFDDELSKVGDVDDVDPASIAHRVEKSGDRALLFLSTRLRPADRLTLVETAKRLTEREFPVVVVSTQLVEAGVDISFDRVYRDLAPIDSIVQAAGRCNRSFERERGRVVVWWLDVPGDQEKTPAAAVYNRDQALLPVVAKTLETVRGDSGVLSETAVAKTAVEKYYERLRSDKNVGRERYSDYVDDAKAEKLSELSLIDQRRSAEIVICRTETDRELVQSIRDAYRERDYEQFRNRLDETKPLRVSIPYYSEDSTTAEAIGSLPPLISDEEYYYLDVDDRPSYFDRATGFVVPGSTAEARIL